MSIELDAVFIKEIGDFGEWVEYALLRCNFCPATAPADGQKAEADALVHDAGTQGWTSFGPFHACGGCRASMYDETRA